ncbi:hypothetical protein ABL78_6439 [Leptomonas seymouri]|uniref:Condensin complex subunit 2 n=1 Tax=Leptomonas seymouri TaxID=5684 RepID=A0A0N1PB07_LEPSE|nr:hypothetical protein ABL78_6439 [Leptomonas seymouri]|eukprot:KPI84504.1 hypothetical protein ABL78_6439 [Leptomonas seymouri]
MLTPEPRRTRNSGGGAESVTPLVDSTNVTPTPRAGYLRRGDTTTLHGALAAGPSVLFDEETGTAVAADASPQPSQLTQQLASGPTRLPRQRPRFHTVQDLDVALNQAIEGKINSRNAWASKEASDLLEGITHTIETTLDAASADDYSGFAKAATVVEGCSKVWTSRVDSTYQQSNQMVQRLLRKDDTSSKVPEEEGDGAEEDDDGTQRSQRNKSRSRSAAAAAAATRTLALDATEINLDSKSRTALTQTGVNAQFRAITSKFDQGNAQGLLMNNAPLGRAGNIILDVDYSLLPTPAKAAGRVSGGRGSGRQGGSHAAAAEPTVPTSLRGDNSAGMDADADSSTAASRTSQHATVERDLAVYESVADLPPYAGVTVVVGPGTASPSSSPNQPSSARASFAFSQHGGAVNNNNSSSSTRASQANQLDPLLLLPHTSSSSSPRNLNLEDGHRLYSSNAEAGQLGEGRPGGSAGGVGRGEEGDGSDGGYGDYGDWGDGGGDAEEDNNDDTPYTTESVRVGADGSDSRNTASSNIGGTVARDTGLEARHLVSGVAEMEAMDTLFHGHTQLALEAEDPTSWCPLSVVAKNPLAGALGQSELSRLHREHRFTQPQKPHMGLTGAGGGVTGADSLLKPESPTSPATKRTRKDRTVVFQLPDTASLQIHAGPSRTTFTTKAELLEDGALRQATTVARNLSPLGKQLLLGKDAAHNVVAYTQSAVQRVKAEQAGLLLPEAPIPGKAIPSYMPYPIRTQDYFQPFSTTLTQWNLLRKSATGRLIDGNGSSTNSGMAMTGPAQHHSAHLHGGTTGHRLGYGGLEGSGAGADDVDDDDDDGTGTGYGCYREADMPVEFFPGGAEVEDADDGDCADPYGPEDNSMNGDDAEERRYVQEGFRSSSDARLLAQVELATTTATAARHSADPLSFSGRSSGGSNTEGLLSDPMELLQVLNPPEATIPSQVDVVRLRQIMWEALQGHLTANQQEKAVDLAALRSGAAGVTSVDADEDAQGLRKGGPVVAKTAVKAHAQAVLDIIRKRARPAAEEEETSSDEGEEGKQLAGGKPGDALALLADAAAAKTGAADIVVTKFSDVVCSVLPHIASISTTNTLSPAFFFFSVLFLSNEHNVVLQNVETLDDLRVCGIARGVGQ